MSFITAKDILRVNIVRIVLKEGSCDVEWVG